MKQPPNLVFCMCDELRFCEVGCYGHPTIRTPHIDRLAQGGVKFEVGLSNTPVCMPARSVVLSGQYARTCCGMTTNAGFPGGAKFSDAGFPQWPTAERRHLPDPTLAELLQKAGYHTAAIGKWHIEAWPDKIGFDHYLIPAHHHAHSAQWFCEDGGPVFSPPGYSVDYEAQRIGQFFKAQANADRPFFLYYNISPPHMPLADAPPKYTGMYRREEVVIRANVDLQTPLANQTDQFLTYLWDYRHYRDKLPYAMKLPDERFDLIDLTRLYMGLVSWVDDTVGAMLHSLEEAGLAENTIVVFCSDHGDNLGSWGWMGKGQWRDESARVPMIVRGPGVSSGVRSRQVASLIDWAPTFLDLAGAATPPHMKGQSLLPVIRGNRTTLDRNYAFIEAPAQGIAVRTPDRVVGLPWDGGDAATLNRPIRSEPSECFNLADDPFSLHNLAPDAMNDADRKLVELILDFDRTTPWKRN